MTGQFVKLFLYFAPLFLERCRSGLTGTPGKRVYLKRVPGVRIPLSPPIENHPADKRDFCFQTADTGLPVRG